MPYWARVPLLLALLSCVGCGPRTDVTAESLRSARRLWDRADLRDYDLEWTTSGRRDGRYLVYVRNGKVREVRSVLPDGRILPARPAEPKFYGVEGLFQVLEEELDQAGRERPFGQAPGSSVLLKFDPDPKLGYPRHFRRDVTGSNLGLSLDVVRFDPNPPTAIPDLPAGAER